MIMFKNFYATTIADQEIEMFRVNYGSQFIILTIELFGGQQDGTITLKKYDRDILAFQQTLTIMAKSPVVLDHKILMPTNYKYSVISNVSGIRVCINAIAEINQNTENYEENSEISETSSSL